MNRDQQDALYTEASAAYGAAIRRLACGYEAESDRRRDLLQEIHLELWMSLNSFDRRCSLRTWVYRIAHNVGASHVMRDRRSKARLVDLEALEAQFDGQAQLHQQLSTVILLDLIHRLKPLDRQIILLYLEGEAAGPISEVTGLSPANIATKIHRIKRVLKQKYMEGTTNARL